MMAKGRLTIATCQFEVTEDISANGRAVRRQMRLAHRRGAEVVHFSECALSGYAGAQFPSFDDYPWGRLDEETLRVRELAAELGLWTILGSSHRRPRGKPTNCLYLIAPDGRILERYEKRFLMPGDRKHYAPGSSLVVHELNGVRFGLLICFDFRFPELWREYLKRGCRLIFFSSYQSSPQRNRLMEKVAPATLTTRASENFFHVAANNTSRPHQWYNTRVHLPDGSVARQARRNRPAVVLHTVDLADDQRFYNPIGPLALRAARGVLHS